jgi:hypothetical protein
LNFIGTPSQEGHKTIFSGLKIDKLALSGLNGGVRPSYGAKTVADFYIPALMKFRKVILRRLKNAGKSI